MSHASDAVARRLIWRSRFRKGFSGLHTGMVVLLLFLLWAMVNYLSFRHYLREDWSQQQLTVMSRQTEVVLEGLEQPVRLIAFTGKEHRVRDMLEDLLNEYDRRSTNVSVVFVDPDRDLGASTDLKRQYHLTQPNQVVVVYGDQNVTVSMDDMVEFESDETRPMGQAPRMVAFRGEPLITSALLRLTGEQRPVVYFLTGHGQKDIDDFEDTMQAYSNVRERLEMENIQVSKMQLEVTRGIPEDAGAVVIAGPTARIPQPELDLLRAYLDDGGRMMVLLNPAADGGLAPLLLEWGIQLVEDIVIDSATLSGAEVYISRFADHPVTRSLRGVNVPFLRPRSVRPAVGGSEQTPGRPRYTALAASSDQSFAKQDLTNNIMRFQPQVDAPGPIPIAAAIEKIPGESRAGDRSTRLVVIGDADFASNRLRGGGGLILFQHSVNWLLDRGHLIEMPPKPVEEIRLQMDGQGLNQLLLIVLVLMPGSAALLGMLVAWRRRT
ncbi:MAG: GldG family protein [Verrucomicrobia bacterium]|nr:GldG family protein [Verrucomicrobiota bacterium]MCH8510386.1 GldG family protein [Kiritimatiellia bacterium]